MSLPIKSDSVEIFSGGAANPSVTAGTADPTLGLSRPEGSIFLRYVISGGQAFIKFGPADTDWDVIATGGGGIGGSLDDAYDFSGAGAGRTIVADAGSLQLNAFTTNTQAALTINRQPGGVAAAIGIDLVLSGNVNASGVGIQIADAGSGTSLKVTKSAAGSVYYADLTNAGAKALEVIVTAAATVSPVSIVANTTGTSAALLSVSKIPGGSTPGDGISVSMGANTTGAGISSTSAGSGLALSVSGNSQFFDGQIYSRRNHATDGTVFVHNNHASNTGPNAIGFLNQAGTFRTYIGLFPSAYGFAHFQSKNGIFCFGGEDLVIGDGTNVTAAFNHTDNSLGIGIANPATVFTDCKLGVESTSGHSLVGIRTLVASSDAVLNFATLTLVTEDASIFLDETDARKFKFATGDVTTDALRNTNTRMVIQQDGRIGIGTTTPIAIYQVHIRRTVAGEAPLLIQSSSATGFSSMNVADEAGTFVLGIGHDNANNTAYIDNPSGNPFLISSLLTTTPALSVRNTSVTGYSATQWLNNSSVAQGSLGYANASAGITHIANKLYWYASTAIDIVFANATRTEHTFGMVSGSSFHELANGSSAAVSAANTGRLRYNSSTQTFQVSLNGAAYTDITTAAPFTLDIGDAIGGSTVGSVLFVGAGNVLQQDNANFFWDDTLNTLRVTSANQPVILGERTGTLTNDLLTCLALKHTTTADMVDAFGSGVRFDIRDSAAVDNPIAFIGAVRAGADNTGDIVLHTYLAGVQTEKVRVTSDGGLQILASTSAVSAASTGRIRYNATGQKFQVSLNGAAYVDLATSDLSVPQSRTLTAGAGLTGGGDLSADRTFDVGAGNGITVNANDVAVNQAFAFAWTSATGHSWDPGTSSANAISLLMVPPGVGGTRDSHYLLIQGASFSTGTPHNSDWRQYVDVTSGDGTSQYVWESRIDAGAFTSRATLSDTGKLSTATIELDAGTSPVNAIFISMDPPGSDGTRDSHYFLIQGASHSGGFSPHTSDWRQYVDVTDNAGNSSYVWESRIDAGAFTERGRLTNSGSFTAFAFTGTGYTQGSILFAGSGGSFLEDNANFFWDNTNNRLGIGTATPGVPLDVSSATTVAAIALRAGSTAAVSAASTGRVRYDESVQRLQGSANTGAYADFKFTTTEYLSADGAADPAVETSFVSGSGTDLTLANGTRGGFIKNFVITGGSGTITPTNLADGDVLTWTASPANVSFIWDATNTTWHVIGNPYNMVTT